LPQLFRRQVLEGAHHACLGGFALDELTDGAASWNREELEESVPQAQRDNDVDHQLAGQPPPSGFEEIAEPGVGEGESDPVGTRYGLEVLEAVRLRAGNRGSDRRRGGLGPRANA